MFVICLSGAKFANETFIFTQRLEMGSNVTNAISLSLANLVGSVVGFLNVLIIRLRSLLLAEADPLKPKEHNKK